MKNEANNSERTIEEVIISRWFSCRKIRVRGLVPDTNPDTKAHRHSVIINKEEGLCMTILMSMTH
jgi:hypothetical protein